MPKSVYKHRDKIKFRGLTYRYNSYYGEWHAVGHKDDRLPQTLFSFGGRWHSQFDSSETPEALLESIVKAEIKALELNVKELTAKLKHNKARIRHMKAKRYAKPKHR